MHLAAPVGQAIELESFGLQPCEQVAHARHLALHDFWIVLHEHSYLFLKLLVVADEVLHRLFERTLFAVDDIGKMHGVEQSTECRASLFVRNDLGKKIKEIVVNEDFSEVEYQILYHIPSATLFNFAHELLFRDDETEMLSFAYRALFVGCSDLEIKFPAIDLGEHGCSTDCLAQSCRLDVRR